MKVQDKAPWVSSDDSGRGPCLEKMVDGKSVGEKRLQRVNRLNVLVLERADKHCWTAEVNVAKKQRKWQQMAAESCCLQTHFMALALSSVTITNSHYVALTAPMNNFLPNFPLKKTSCSQNLHCSWLQNSKSYSSNEPWLIPVQNGYLNIMF